MVSTKQVLIPFLTMMVFWCLCRGQNLDKEGPLLVMMTIVDTLDQISLRLQERDERMEVRLQGLESELAAVKASQAIIEKNLEEQRLENQHCAQRDQVENLHNALATGQQEMATSLQYHCSRDQISDLQNLLATDECMDRSDECSDLAICKDLPIRYKCECSPGYSGDGFTCQDINECDKEESICGEREVCLNIPGSYSCICQAGYRREADTCQDIDECGEQSFTCGEHETCSNNAGNYSCVCEERYKRKGNICEGPTCLPPSLHLEDLGCLTLVNKTGMTWNEGKVTCQKINNRRLLENVRKDHMETLRHHFRDMMGDYTGAWIGLKNSRWLSSGDSVDDILWESGEPHGGGHQECGLINLHISSSVGLKDGSCNWRGYPVCQTLD